jgi:hypothetical protein
MKLFRYREDILPVICIVSLSVLDLLVFFQARGVWMLTAWLVLVIGPKACICSWNHHHQHLLTFHQSVLNRLLELSYAFHTGITTNAWVLHHVVGHHVNYLDQTKDESAWKRRDGSMMGELEYTVVIALTGYLRAFAKARRYPRYRLGFYGMGLVVLALLGAAVVWSPLNAMFVFAIPMAAGYVITRHRWRSRQNSRNGSVTAGRRPCLRLPGKTDGRNRGGRVKSRLAKSPFDFCLPALDLHVWLLLLLVIRAAWHRVTSAQNTSPESVQEAVSRASWHEWDRAGTSRPSAPSISGNSGKRAN